MHVRDVKIADTLRVSGVTTFVGEVRVDNNMVIGRSLYVTGSVGMGGKLTVTGSANFKNTLHAKDIRVANTLSISGSGTIGKDVPGNTKHHGQAHFDVAGTITGNVGYFNQLF